jgi:hypothetical protein
VSTEKRLICNGIKAAAQAITSRELPAQRRCRPRIVNEPVLLVIPPPPGKLGTTHPEKLPVSKFPFEINSAALAEELPEKQMKAGNRIVRTNCVNAGLVTLTGNV